MAIFEIIEILDLPAGDAFRTLLIDRLATRYLAGAAIVPTLWRCRPVCC